MKFLFTKSNLPGSRLIRWGLNTDVSHFAILFMEDLGDNAIVIESRLGQGVRPIWLKDFLAHNDVVTAVAHDTDQEKYLYGKILDKVGGQPYDWKAVTFLSVAVIMKKLFKRPLPKKNLWGAKDMQYCSEVLNAMTSYLKQHGVPVHVYGNQMLTPERAREILLWSDEFKEQKKWQVS